VQPAECHVGERDPSRGPHRGHPHVLCQRSHNRARCVMGSCRDARVFVGQAQKEAVEQRENQLEEVQHVVEFVAAAAEQVSQAAEKAPA